MKVLLDESCPARLRAHLAHHDTFTAVYAGFGGFRNGDLLRNTRKTEYGASQFLDPLVMRAAPFALLKAAEDVGFDVLVTADKTLRTNRI